MNQVITSSHVHNSGSSLINFVPHYTDYSSRFRFSVHGGTKPSYICSESRRLCAEYAWKGLGLFCEFRGVLTWLDYI